MIMSLTVCTGSHEDFYESKIVPLIYCSSSILLLLQPCGFQGPASTVTVVTAAITFWSQLSGINLINFVIILLIAVPVLLSLKKLPIKLSNFENGIFCQTILLLMWDCYDKVV